MTGRVASRQPEDHEGVRQPRVGNVRRAANVHCAVDTLLLDLRHGARLLYRQAGFTLVAVLALGLGIGVNTTVFTLGEALLFRRLDA